ncbi:hypothetical protein EDD18DRAFT_1356870 [Armillaria luteobubalina]|uniref:Uncharacterized protein n=1 Tax=Armillaria luteobubalina TaxID=153913 RepID=A0AA39Q270_9AGAR|nr:hypothetical protein EDD18DRAFT_1356870 [Armillaria luteobubalina]
MQCKSLIAALLALSIVFVSAAPLPDLPDGVHADVEVIEADVGRESLPAIDLSDGVPFVINQSPSITNYDRYSSPDIKYLLIPG